MNSKTSQKDKQPKKDSTKKKENIISYNIISILRLLICYLILISFERN
jgi:hypothetical protein